MPNNRDAEIEALLAAWRRLTDMANIGRRAANVAATEDPDEIASLIRLGMAGRRVAEERARLSNGD